MFFSQVLRDMWITETINTHYFLGKKMSEKNLLAQMMDRKKEEPVIFYNLKGVNQCPKFTRR